MEKLQHIRFEEYRHGMETKWQRSYRGTTSLGYRMEKRLVDTLKRALPHTMIIHMDPYGLEDEKYYYEHEITRPNPEFPPKSNASYIFQTLGRQDRERS